MELEYRYSNESGFKYVWRSDGMKYYYSDRKWIPNDEAKDVFFGFYDRGTPYITEEKAMQIIKEEQEKFDQRHAKR